MEEHDRKPVCLDTHHVDSEKRNRQISFVLLIFKSRFEKSW
jgi:hypothetical protein